MIKMIKIHYLLFLLLVLLVLVCLSNQAGLVENFAVQFGTPPESTASDSSNIQGLLEIGSQAQENTTYDSVSTHHLGDISRPTPTPPPPPPPDPVCFTSPSSSSDQPTEITAATQECCSGTDSYDI